MLSQKCPEVAQDFVAFPKVLSRLSLVPLIQEAEAEGEQAHGSAA